VTVDSVPRKGTSAFISQYVPGSPRMPVVLVAAHAPPTARTRRPLGALMARSFRQTWRAMRDPLFPPSYEDWAAEHQMLLRLVVELFMAAGEWPTLNELQRDLVRDGVRIDVGAAAHGIPNPLGFRQGERLVLTLFGLRLVPESAPLLDAFMQALHTAAARYVDPDNPSPVLSDRDVPGGRAAKEIVAREAPFLGSTVAARVDGEWWTRRVDRAMARYLDIKTIDDYLRQRRDELESSPVWNWPQEPPRQPRARFDARGALEFLLAAATVVGLVLAAPLWVGAATAGATVAYGLMRSSRLAWAVAVAVATLCWIGYSLAHARHHQPHASGSAIVGFVGGCSNYQVYAQNRWKPYGTIIRTSPSTLSTPNGTFAPNQVVAVNGWVQSQVAYPTNDPPFNNDIWFHLADGAGWVSFGGVRATPVSEDPTGHAGGGAPAPAPTKCKGAIQ
jgi:hypothetical protein